MRDLTRWHLATAFSALYDPEPVMHFRDFLDQAALDLFARERPQEIVRVVFETHDRTCDARD